MRTIRRRLTVGYTLALLGTLLAFGAALYYELRKPSQQVLDQRATLEAEFARRWLEESYRVLSGLVITNPRPALDPGIAAYLEGFRDHLVVADRSGQVLYLSGLTRDLDFGAVETLTRELRQAPTSRRYGTLSLGPSRAAVRFVVEPVLNAGPDVGGILVATSVDESAVDPTIVLRSMLVVAPLIALFALGLGYWLAGEAIKPLEGIMDEVEAISDGRSLHRRLAVPISGDEIARLALTLNGMLARLEQSFGSLRRFTADASHELKTPLMVLRAGVERALTHPRTPAEVLVNLDETLEQINQMSEMVDALLTLARADEGRAPLAVERTDLRDLLAEAVETAGMLGEEADVRIEQEIPGEPVLAEVDKHRIRELLLNLVTNAVKYTPVGGMVRLSLEATATAAVIRVKDSGIGIAPGDLPYIFERFWRADPARSRTGDRPGTGLGLAITKWIAEVHGGSITVQSRPGRGTTFVVTIPLPKEPEPHVTTT